MNTVKSEGYDMELKSWERIPVAALIEAIKLKEAGQTWDTVFEELCAYWYTTPVQDSSPRRLRYQVDKFKKKRA